MENDAITPPDRKRRDVTEAFTKFMEIQEREIDLKAKELTVREKEIESNKEIALHAIDAQATDRKHQANFFDRLENKKLIFRIVVTLAVVAVIIVSMLTGNIRYTVELAKIAGGVLVGYLVGKYKGVAEQQRGQNQHTETEDNQ